MGELTKAADMQPLWCIWVKIRRDAGGIVRNRIEIV
jgi:hypothetical protein